MAKESDRKGSKVGTALPFRFRPAHQILQPPKLLPAGGPVLGAWTRPIDELATRSRDVGQGIRRRTLRFVRESLTCSLAIVWVTFIGCASAIGWRRPQRVLAAAAIFSVPWVFLALPAEGLVVTTWAELLAAGNWAASAALTAALLGGSLIVFHFVMALVHVPLAREKLPMLCIQDRLLQAENLFFDPVEREDQFRQWIGRVQSWTRAVETELRELHSPDVAYKFRCLTPGTAIRYQHRYNVVHDGWLNMLSWRGDLLADLLDPRARDSATRAPSEFRQVA
jgi:hypothetical protein